MAIQLNRTSADERGDPDLYGLFLSPEVRGLDVQNPGWDFQETSGASRDTELVRISRADYDPEKGSSVNGLMLCINAYGAVNVSTALRARRDVCPIGFDPGDGVTTICSTRVDAPEADKRYSSCTAEGKCICTGEYALPVSDVFSGGCLFVLKETLKLPTSNDPDGM